MANLIAQTEDALLALCKAALRGTVKTYGTAPADWDEAIAKQLLAGAPAVYVAFLGWQPRPGDYYEPLFTANFALYAVTALGNEDQRRRGTPVAIGAYDIACVLAAALTGRQLALEDQAPSLRVGACTNLFTTALWNLGGTCYGLQIDVPLALPPALPEGLASFQVLHADWDAEPAASGEDHDRWVQEDHTAPAPKAHDEVHLEGRDPP
jgi:phage gp37-like protein